MSKQVEEYLKKQSSVIFLDIDGVLNSVETMTRNFYAQPEKVRNCREDRTDWPDAELVANLNYIIEQTNACIVVSSTWRYMGLEKVSECLYKAGVVGNIIDITGKHPHGIRGYEIISWLSQYHYKVKNFVILDDDTDMVFVSPYSVKTNVKTGLTKECAEEAVRILNTRIMEGF